MKVGLMIYDPDPKATLDIKIIRAVEDYKVKYGRTPNCVYVHPVMLRQDGGRNGGTVPVEVRTSRSILPNNFWVGITEVIHVDNPADSGRSLGYDNRDGFNYNEYAVVASE